MKPLKDLLIVEIQDTDKRDSGLYVREAWAKPKNIAKILEVGPFVSPEFELGELVVINPYAVIDTEEKPVKIIKERDILCRISPDQTEDK